MGSVEFLECSSALSSKNSYVKSKSNNTFTPESTNCRPASIYLTTVLVDFQRPWRWMERIEAPSLADSVAKPRRREWAGIGKAGFKGQLPQN